jgi:hypothetical protein
MNFHLPKGDAKDFKCEIEIYRVKRYPYKLFSNFNQLLVTPYKCGRWKVFIRNLVPGKPAMNFHLPKGDAKDFKCEID